MTKHNIPYGRQHITEEDIQAVTDVLRSDFLTQGPKVQEFEEAFANYVGAKYAVAVANGTAALHLANIAMDVKPGQKVLTTPITFAATANSVLFCGGEVDFIDIDPDTYLMDLDLLEAKLKSVPRGTYCGVISVDFAGLPVNTERLRALADEFNLWIIEDACHAPGAHFMNANKENIYCGSGIYADLTCFSFHPVKHIAAGEGGMITTNDEALYKRLVRLRTHGITKDSMGSNPGGWYYEMHELGFNYRLPDVNAALGLSQLKKAVVGFQKRQEIAAKYTKAFQGSNKIKTQKKLKDVTNAFHLYIIEIADRKGLYDYLRENGIYAQVHYIPIPQLPYYARLGFRIEDYPLAHNYYNHCLSLPMYPSLAADEQEFVINSILKFVG